MWTSLGAGSDVKLIVPLPVTDTETETHLAKSADGGEGRRVNWFERRSISTNWTDGGPETSLLSQICRESSFPRACTYRIARIENVSTAETTLSTVEGCHTVEPANLISYQLTEKGERNFSRPVESLGLILLSRTRTHTMKVIVPAASFSFRW